LPDKQLIQSLTVSSDARDEKYDPDVLNLVVCLKFCKFDQAYESPVFCFLKTSRDYKQAKGRREWVQL
jgi:hypothetical protein